ncbi:hypothetical protein [Corynebacterium lipophiloflavum]|uniref:Lipoprotein n=1 Tax=Corynebacterium lipophiloflavum (strain ATCC 700352 / DSM 44291 / CCUG 37336 / JCM 10383 / DMMZ 1944) TaxID=525263 RepID=C0XRA6_CORLD|nr:hypothetical protein [Corynebacterium lipophiloflavum]EEI17240.1 hypothetical protein HMPREF0298_0976 [Corynebacterium lipophiloflavum DSM 44291]
MKNKKIATAATILASGALLAACGSSSDYDGAWSGTATPADAAKGEAQAQITLDGGDCEWTVTEANGETNDAKCERDGDEFQFVDPKTGRDLNYNAQLNGDTLTLSPDNGQAEGLGTIVLTRTAAK